jgi:hypothetical protein
MNSSTGGSMTLALQFLAMHEFVVDVTLNYEFPHQCPILENSQTVVIVVFMCIL